MSTCTESSYFFAQSDVTAQCARLTSDAEIVGQLTAGGGGWEVVYGGGGTSVSAPTCKLVSQYRHHTERGALSAGGDICGDKRLGIITDVTEVIENI